MATPGTGSSGGIAGSVEIEVRARMDRFDREMQELRTRLDRFHKDTQAGFNRLQQGVNGVTNAIGTMRAMVAAVAGGALANFIKRNAQMGSELAKTAQTIGITTERLQELRYAAGTADVSAEELDQSLRILSRNLGDRSGQVTNFSKALGQLGLRMEDLKGLNFDEKLALISDRLSKVQDQTKRNSLAMDLFGRAGIQAINVLGAGSAVMQKLSAEAHKLGLILGKETIDKATASNDEIVKMGTAWKVAGINISATFLPALVEIRKVMTDPGFQTGVKNVTSAISELVQFLVRNRNALMTAVVAFAGLKLGASAGRVFGPKGAVAGGLIGLLTALMAAETLKSDEYLEHREELARKIGEGADAPIRLPVVTITNPNRIFPEIDQMIKDLRIKRGALSNEFKGFAEGFPEMFHGLRLEGVDAFAILSQGAEKLTGQFKQLHDAFARVNAEQLRDQIRSPLEQYNRELEKAGNLLKANAISQEEFNRRANQLAFPQLTAAIGDAQNWRGQIDQIATGSLTKLSDTMASVALGTEKASVAFNKMAVSVISDLTAMIIKAQLFRVVSMFMPGMGMGGAGGLLSSLFGGGASVGGGIGALAGIAHGGGIAGNVASTNRLPIMHSGGINPRERVVLVEKDEEILTSGDPRHRNNQGSGGQPVYITNHIEADVTADTAMMIARNTASQVEQLGRVVKSQNKAIKSMPDNLNAAAEQRPLRWGMGR